MIASTLNALKRTWRAAAGAIGPDRGRFGVLCGFALVSGFLETMLLYDFALLALAITGNPKFAAHRLGPPSIHISVPLLMWGAGALIVALLGISFVLSALQASLGSRAIMRKREALLSAYLDASLAYRDTHQEGFLQNLIGEQCQRLETAVLNLSFFCVGAASVVVLTAGAFLASPRTATIFIVVLTAGAAIGEPTLRRLRKDPSVNVQINRSVGSQAAQIARISKEITAFGVARQASDRMKRSIREAGEVQRQLRYQNRLAPSLYLYGALGLILVCVATTGALAPAGDPGLAPVALLLLRALAFFRQCMLTGDVVRESFASVEILDREAELLAQAVRPRTGEPVGVLRELELADVSHEYVPGHPVLSGVDLRLTAGEAVGIVGPSGSGKSTLCALLLRLRTPTAGEITVNGTPLRAVAEDAWVRVAAFVPQESGLIAGTVSENIRFFRDGFGDAEVEAAARGAHVHDAIMELPQGYDTEIGPGRRAMSGGQGQRLAIARALLARPQLLVLDEPTSALDQQTEQSILETLGDLKGRMTIVIVTHRPAMLAVCDRVVHIAAPVDVAAQ